MRRHWTRARPCSTSQIPVQRPDIGRRCAAAPANNFGARAFPFQRARYKFMNAAVVFLKAPAKIAVRMPHAVGVKADSTAVNGR